MRVLIITTQDKFFLSHVKDRAIYFKRQGCLVAVAAQKTSDEYAEKIESLGISFFDTKIIRQSLNPFSQLLAIYRLFHIQAIFHPDVSYHLGAKAIFYGTLTARLYNKKVAILNAPIGLGYVFASNSLKARALRPLVMFLYKCFLNPPKSRVIVENIDDIHFFIQKGYLKAKDAFCVLGAGINTQVFHPIPFEKRHKICTVVMASRLIKEKGVWDFVAAAEILYKMKIPVRMLLVGEPDYGNPSSITKAEFIKLSNNPALRCLGFQSNILPILQNAHICCLPSYYREGLPRILVEAASVGLVLLTTDTIGCKESIREKNGFLFKVHDVEKIVSLIKYLVEHPDELLNMSRNSRDVATKYFDNEIICGRTFEIIRSMGFK